MKAALIPPKGYFGTALQSKYHLVLAQISDPEYRRVYDSMLPDDHYVIVDNGAAEGEPVDDDTLLRTALAIGADEIVVPDMLGDYAETIKRVKAFHDRNERVVGLKYMHVIQGTTMDEVKDCVAFYMHRYPGCVLGIPRHLLTTLKDGFARFRVAHYIEENFGRKTEVHLLGTNPTWPSEIKYLSSMHKWIRGVDSSMPYNYAMHHEILQDGTFIERPPGYFTWNTVILSDLLESNIQTFLGWAHGTEGTRR